MNEKLCRDVKIAMSHCDFRLRLGVAQAAGLMMDSAAEHSEVLDIGFDKMAQRDYFWMVARCRYRFHRMPRAYEETTLSTWLGRIKYATSYRYYTLTEGDELLAEGMTEWVLFNTREAKLDTNAQESVKDIPTNDEIVCEGRKLRMSRDFSDCAELGRYTVCATDIDVGHHMNNVAYIRALLGRFTVAELEKMDIRELEINYIAQCREGEELSFRRRDTEDGMDIGILRADGTVGAAVHLIIG